jgi:hypothetical protein
MRRFPLVLVLLAGAAGCRPTGAARLEGKWKGIRAEGVTAEAQASANAFAAQMEIEVKGESISVATSAGRQESKFYVVKEDKSSIVIATDRDGPEDKQTFTFLDERTMKWQVVEGKTITFARK